MSDTLRVAVLVDADNVESHQIRFAVEQARKFGTVTLRRAFGRLASIKGREKTLAELGFAAEVALPAARATKNTADLLIAQFAVRLAERGAVDMIALVSSDGDFASIARGVAEAGVPSIDFGRADTPEAMRQACVSFTPFPENATAKPAGGNSVAISSRDLEKLKEVIDNALDSSRRARLAPLGIQINRAFDGQYKKHFGVATLTKLLEKIDGYDVQGQGVDKSIVATGRKKKA